MSNIYDVIITGAGPAGCSAAIFLGKKGYNVLLVDRAEFPRNKVCGDGLSPSSMSFLKKINLYDEVMALNPQKTHGAIITSPTGKVVKGVFTQKENEPEVHGIVIPRKKFDHILFKHTKTYSNIDVRENFKVTDLLFENGKPAGIIGKSNNDTITLKGKYIIAADGVHSIIAQKLSLKNNIPKHKAICIRAYFENVRDLEDLIEIHYEKSVMPGYGWVFPTGENTANVGAGITLGYKESKDMKNIFDIIIENNKFMKEKLKDATMIKDSIQGFPLSLGSFPAKRSSHNVLLTGDAGSFIDSLSGEGINTALRTGEFAAMAIDKGFTNGEDPDEVARYYEKLWKKEFKWKDFVPGYIFQKIFRNQTIMNYSLNRASKNPRRAETFVNIITHRIPKSSLGKIIRGLR
ncbi:MAG: geranylgeranyl reductase family protein [bacterium]|nr:geranylgeranyl reductase family protein [bacterium]